EFRILYELNRDTDKTIVYVCRDPFLVLPDICNRAKVINLSLRDFFPFLDGTALNGLSFSVLNTLSGFKIYEPLGYNKTIKFLLENIYNVDFDTLKSGHGKERLLNALITVFLERNGVNQSITDFLSQQARPFFPDLIEEGLIKNNLLRFIESQWEKWINQEDKNIDFDEFYLAKTVGYLFIKRHLHPLKVTKEKYESLSSKTGVYYDSKQSLIDEFHTLIEYLGSTIIKIEDRPQEWYEIIQVISRAKIHPLKCKNQKLEDDFNQIEERINDRFQLFLESNYDSLVTRSGSKHPFLVTRIMEYIRYQSHKKKALIVIDGLSFWQWMLIADSLSQESFEIESKATFAWIPTITAWSRQTIFRGDLPVLDETNAFEEKHFTEYWKNLEYSKHQIGYKKFGVNKSIDTSDLASYSILGLVVNDLDDLMHGVLMGDEQLYLSTNQWIEKEVLSSIIKDLGKAGFKIYITTDHGNIEAQGIRNLKLSEKFGALSRSRRHIRFSNETLKNDFLKNNPSLPVGAKDLSVYLKDKTAFVTEKERLITHGGSHFWEVIIPFIEI
ncbi:BREX-3 system phosphatase PglZ, partial [Bacteroidota bacterium]